MECAGCLPRVGHAQSRGHPSQVVTAGRAGPRRRRPIQAQLGPYQQGAADRVRRLRELVGTGQEWGLRAVNANGGEQTAWVSSMRMGRAKRSRPRTASSCTATRTLHAARCGTDTVLSHDWGVSGGDCIFQPQDCDHLEIWSLRNICIIGMTRCSLPQERSDEELPEMT